MRYISKWHSIKRVVDFWCHHIVPSNNGLVRETFNLKMVSSILPGMTRFKGGSSKYCMIKTFEIGFKR